MTESDDFGAPGTSFLWMIKDFASWPVSKAAQLESVTFCIDKCADKQWCIILGSALDDTWLEPTIMLMETETFEMTTDETCEECERKNEVNASIMVSLIDSKFCETNTEHREHLFTLCSTCCFTNFINIGVLLNDQRNLHSGRDLLLHFVITIEDKASSCRHSTNCNLLNCQEYLLESSYFSDYIIEVKNKEFPCHKSILACRSEYFLGLFKSGMKETIESISLLKDMEPNIFKHILRYIYTGQVSELLSLTEYFKLAVAADRFQLTRLKDISERKLHSCLCLENRKEIFKYASIHNLPRLKMIAFRLLTEFAKDITDFDEPEEISSEEGGSQDMNELSAKRRKTDDSVSAVAQNEVPFATCLRHTSKDTKMFPRKLDFVYITESCVLATNNWRIENFKRYNFSCTSSLSPCIVSGEDATWQIELGVGVHNRVSQYLYLYVILTSARDGNLCTEYKFCILNTEFKETKVLRGICNCLLNTSVKIPFVPSESILSNYNLLHGLDLIIRCSFMIRKSILHDCTYPPLSKCELEDDMLSLVEKQIHTDVTVEIETQIFPCHKAILGYYSSYFASKLQESPSSKAIEVNDIKPNVFGKILSTMYTGVCKLTASEVLELVPVAGKYGFFDKTTVFDDAFVSSLSIENAAKTLLSAHNGDATKLRGLTLKFVAQTLENVMQTSDWDEVAQHEELFNACLKPDIL